MNDPTDKFPDYAGWSVEQIDAYELALGGMIDGDLHDLAAYLRAGYPLEGHLAERLADAIDGTGRVQIHLRATRPGVPLAEFDHGAHAEKLAVGATIHVLLERAPRAHAASVKHTFAQERDYSENKVKGALTYFRKQLEGKGGSMWDQLGARFQLEKARRELEED